MREQLKFLEGIDRVHTKRKQEQEREKLLKAAKVIMYCMCSSLVCVLIISIYVYYIVHAYVSCMLIHVGAP